MAEHIPKEMWPKILTQHAGMGLTKVATAARLGVSPATIGYQCRKHGDPWAAARASRMASTIRVEQRQRRGDGGIAHAVSDDDLSMLTNEQIASKHGTSAKYIGKIRHARGVPHPNTMRRDVVRVLLEMSGLNGRVSETELHGMYPGVRKSHVMKCAEAHANIPDGYRRLMGTRFAVSREGGVVRRECGKWVDVTTRQTHKGRIRVSLGRSDGIEFGGGAVFVHHLVYLAWVGPIPPNMEIDHVDGDPTNNHADNLEVVDPEENRARCAYNDWAGQKMPRWRNCYLVPHWLSQAGPPVDLQSP